MRSRTLALVATLVMAATACGGGASRARPRSTSGLPAPESAHRASTTAAPTSTTGVPGTATAASSTTVPIPAPPPLGNYTVAEQQHYWVRRGAGGINRPLPTLLYLPTTRATANGPRGFPLLVWAHGFDATADYFDPLLRSWAARGYVVAAPTFPLTRSGGTGRNRFDDYVNQPADVSFVITQVLSLEGPGGADHAGLVDPNRIAVAGHSLGAITTRGLVANNCCLDQRVRAAIEVDGGLLQLPGNAVHPAVPTLFIHGTADTTFPVSASQTLYAAASPPKYLVLLAGAPHTPFQVAWARTVVERVVADFLDLTVRSDPAAGQQLRSDVSASGRATLTAAP